MTEQTGGAGKRELGERKGEGEEGEGRGREGGRQQNEEVNTQIDSSSSSLT